MKSEHLEVARGPESHFATTAEAARFLGLSKAMIHKMIRAEQMPARRYGRAIRIPMAWLQAEAARSVAPAPA